MLIGFLILLGVVATVKWYGDKMEAYDKWVDSQLEKSADLHNKFFVSLMTTENKSLTKNRLYRGRYINEDVVEILDDALNFTKHWKWNLHEVDR